MSLDARASHLHTEVDQFRLPALNERGRIMAQRETPRLPSPAATAEYLTDAWQRSILFLDVMRRRAAQYEAHAAELTPNVLDFKAELVLDGRGLASPASALNW